ncbi:MAG: hypothetical protein MUF27_14205 [Acidobacteria bacterium]|nr:hypothetical protein [Acidobacteriota bacterium]
MALGAMPVSLLLAVAGTAVPPAGKEGALPPPPPRAIPGITAADPFRNACVDCHVARPDIAVDARFATALAAWGETVRPDLLERAQAAAPRGVTLKGKHPPVPGALADIPRSCMACHDDASKLAPPFSRLMHSIHLSGGEKNHFLTIFQGECTHCHKLDDVTGALSVPSGPEK